MEHGANYAFYIAALIGIGALCQWSAWRLRLPAILPLLIVGLLLGPTFGVLDPDAVLGDLLFPLVSLGVAIILFEGSLTLRLEEIRNVAADGLVPEDYHYPRLEVMADALAAPTSESDPAPAGARA